MFNFLRNYHMVFHSGCPFPPTVHKGRPAPPTISLTPVHSGSIPSVTLPNPQSSPRFFSLTQHPICLGIMTLPANTEHSGYFLQPPPVPFICLSPSGSGSETKTRVQVAYRGGDPRRQGGRKGGKANRKVCVFSRSLV